MRAWRLLGGQRGVLNLSALDVVCEHLGITDICAALVQIEAIADYVAALPSEPR